MSGAEVEAPIPATSEPQIEAEREAEPKQFTGPACGEQKPLSHRKRLPRNPGDT